MNRRSLLTSAALGLATVAVGTVAVAATADPALAVPVAPATPETARAVAATSDPIEPAGGAGVFDVDLDQSDVSQDPNVVATGDVSAMPEDWEF